MQFAGRLMRIGIVVVLVSGFSGCKKQDSGQKAGAAVDKAVQDAGAAADQAVQKAGKSVEKAGKEVQKSAQ
jgi:hypothetical protein